MPLELRSTGSVHLGTVSDLVLSFVRAVDDTTGTVICFQTIVFRRSSEGYGTGGKNSPAIRVLTFTSAGGALDDWVATEHQDFACGENAVYTTFRKEFRPDWFDIVGRAVLTVGPSTWYRCS